MSYTLPPPPKWSRVCCYKCLLPIPDIPSGRGALRTHLREEHGVPEEVLPDFGDEEVIGGEPR